MRWFAVTVIFGILVGLLTYELGGTDGKPLDPEPPKHEAVQARAVLQSQRAEFFLVVERRLAAEEAARVEAARLEQERVNAQKAQDEARRRQAAAQRRTTTRTTTGHTGPSTGRCGGDLPPCWVMERESGGNIHAYNPTGCNEGGGVRGCRGKWQCSTSTCRGTGTEAEQDAEARRLWNGGKGCQHWDACGAPK